MEISASTFIFLLLLVLLFFETTAGCIINTCSYAMDTRAMDCEGRQLVCVPSNRLYRQSETVKLAQNLIPTIRSSSFAGYSGLVQLDISNNVIVTLETNAFHNLRRLQRLYINFNQITEIGATSFSMLGNLRILQLQGNNINVIHPNAFNDLVGIRELNLAGNRLTTLPDGVFSSMTSMQFLFLQENQLTSSPNSHFLRGLRGLQDIDLDGNRFSAIPQLKGLSQLNAFDMTDSHVTTIANNTFLNAITLRDVVLSGNVISLIEPLAFVGLQNTVELDLSYNAIADIPEIAFAPLRNLEVLLLQSNSISSITTEHFRSLRALRTLSLEGNLLQRLPVMNSLLALTVLNVKSNLLETFDQQTLQSLTRLNKLQLVGNKLQCDCRLRALKQFYIASGRAHHPHEIPLCNAPKPPSLRGSRITTVSGEDFVCTAPTIRSGMTTLHSMESSSAILSCISNGFPSPVITWSSPNGLIYRYGETGRVTVTRSGELAFRVVEVRDQGRYTCVGTNPAGTARATVRLVVTPNPKKPPQTTPTVPNQGPVTLQPPHNTTTQQPLPAGTVKTLTSKRIMKPITGLSSGPRGTKAETTVNIPTKKPTDSNLVDTGITVDITGDDAVETPGRKRNTSDEKHRVKVDNDFPIITEPSNREGDENAIAPSCIKGNASGVLGAIFSTFIITMACVFAGFAAWRRGLIPHALTTNVKKERLINIRRQESLNSTSSVPTNIGSQRRIIRPSSSLRSGIHSNEDSSLGSSYSFSEVSTESVSVSSREETARYVTTESVADPDSVRMRQQRLAAIANSSAFLSSLSDSENSSSCTPRQTSQRRLYANAEVVQQDPNYTSLWRQGENPQQMSGIEYERARNDVDSRIYIDVR
ncbi:Leucine-rich repeat and immunoglobulin-like domain-containing nogo receptor-interacting protein 2 [Holothuria leucospilota]|uniref:Leucine-rich repeat and immunoglobulin-like domain-containing nogo receptor-interacting protein 2 n=1 Tax=Holothuria leucospilota TaxID=206669 RepID=A0A9Q0YLU3_HOLLE|nr:Leucine-rich repeat and immunoglobulin-like domain-containing nogo receptor-interacting protein 2 [Holothuria leucospilota]